MFDDYRPKDNDFCQELTQLCDSSAEAMFVCLSVHTIVNFGKLNLDLPLPLIPSISLFFPTFQESTHFHSPSLLS